MDNIKIVFAGDTVYPFEDFNKENVFGNQLLRTLELNDLIIINLEAPLKSDFPIRKVVNLFSSKKIIDFLNVFNSSVCNLANNHVYDYGDQGISLLKENLRINNIPYFGLMDDVNKYATPLIKEIKGVRIGLLGFAWDIIESKNVKKGESGTAPLEAEFILESIRAAKKSCDFLVINFHWGYEFEEYPLPAHKLLAHKSIDNGADLVIGTHPHVFQGVENYRNKAIIYSLGNFYLPEVKYDKKELRFNKREPNGMIACISINQNLDYSYELLGLNFNRTQNFLDLSDNMDGFIKRICTLSSPLELNIDIYKKKFKSIRIRRKGLPIFTGDDKADKLRRVIIKLRSSVVRVIRKQ